MPGISRNLRDLAFTGPKHGCHLVAPVTATQSTVFANNTPMLRTFDPLVPHLMLVGIFCVIHYTVVWGSSPNVFAEGKQVSRKGDSADFGFMLMGSSNVFANGAGGLAGAIVGSVVKAQIGPLLPSFGGAPVDANSPAGGGSYCFDPDTLIQMTNAPDKKIKDIQLGDETRGGTVTGVFQFRASDDIHNYKGVIVAGSHYVKEDGRFIPVAESTEAVRIDRIPVVYSIDTTGRRIFINDIEFADYNGDGIAKEFLTNAGVDMSGYDEEMLRQVESKLI
jgi:uncharacterized Zn-binding protein involved in type VI secretion